MRHSDPSWAEVLEVPRKRGSPKAKICLACGREFFPLNQNKASYCYDPECFDERQKKQSEWHRKYYRNKRKQERLQRLTKKRAED